MNMTSVLRGWEEQVRTIADNLEKLCNIFLCGQIS